MINNHCFYYLWVRFPIKERKRSEKMGFKYSNVRLNNISKEKDKNGNPQLLKKWYVSYTILYDNDIYPDYKVQEGKEQQSIKNKKYPKIFGNGYKLRLNDIKDPEEKLLMGEWLVGKIKEDLLLGIDPRLKDEDEDEKAEIAHIESNGVSFDEALKLTRKYMQWDLGLPAQQITETQNMSFFNNGFRRFIHFIGKTNDVTKVTTNDLKKFVELTTNQDGTTFEFNGKTKTFGHTSVKTAFEKIRVVASIFNALLDEGKIEVNPCLGVTDIKRKVKKTAKPRPVTNKNRFEIWSDEELKRFHDVGNKGKWKTQYTIGLITYYTFIRASEILRLKLGMIDYVNNKFIIPSNLTKGHSKHETIEYLHQPIPPILMDILKGYITATFGNDLNPDYPLFTSPRLGIEFAYSYESYKTNYKYFKKDLGIEKNEYALKHSGVTDYYYMQLKAGVPSYVIADELRIMCRHATWNETMKYLKLNLGLRFTDNVNNGWGAY